MSKISEWSKTAADNNSASPDGAPEGMAPSGVNDTIRENMAQIRTQWEDAQWFDLGDVPTRTDNDTFTVPGDKTAEYHVGRRLKLTDATTIYATISAVAFGSVTTVDVTTDSGNLSASLTAVALGIVTVTNTGTPSVANIGRGAYSGLTIKPNVTNPTYQMDIDADSITLTDGSVTYDATSVNLTADITASGANGLDTGSEANSTFYSVWAIYNGTTVAGLLSLSATAPTMPSGYTYKRRVGWVYNDSSGNLWDTRQVGNAVDTQSTLLETILSGGTADVYTELTPTVPSTAHIVRIKALSASNQSIFLSRDGTNFTDGLTSSPQTSSILFQLNASQTFYYKRAIANSTADIELYGWIDNL